MSLGAALGEELVVKPLEAISILPEVKATCNIES